MKLKSLLIVLVFISLVFSCKFLWNTEVKKPKPQKESLSIKVSYKIPFYPTGEIISHTYYSFQYSEKHEQALWVAYKLTPYFLIKNADRKNKFKADSKISTGSASLGDYKGSGFDRGHLAPAGSMVVNQKAMDESFYMSNMSPQVPGFNRGIWKRLEEQVRNWARTKDSVFVVTGPVLKNIKKHIGPNKVSVPNKYYKVLLSFKNHQANGIAFLLDNSSSKKNISSFAVPIDSVETLTGIDFNPSLNTEIENFIEGTFDYTIW